MELISEKHSLYLIIKDYLTRRVVMMEDGYHIVERQYKRGCPQGSVLVPKFWNLVMDSLLRQLEELPSTQPIAYSDDLVILILENSRRALVERGAAVMAILESWASSNKLTVSERKTVGMLLKGAAPPSTTGYTNCGRQSEIPGEC